MKFSKVATAATLTIAIGAFAPSVFAQVGAGGAASGMPAAGSSGITNQARLRVSPGPRLLPVQHLLELLQAITWQTRGRMVRNTPQ